MSKTEGRTGTLLVRMSPTERRQLERLARDSGINMADALRRGLQREIQIMAKQRKVPRYSYLHEKLGQLIHEMMCTQEPTEMSASVARALDPLREASALDDESAKLWRQRILDLAEPKDEDIKDPAAKVVGAIAVRLRKLGRDDRYQLATAIWELYTHLEGELYGMPV